MKDMNGKSQLRTISRAFPVSISVLEVLFLVSLGVIAVVLRAKLRIPMQMPGRHGLEVMALLMIGRKASNLPIATSISTFAAAFMVMFPFMGFSDPSMPVIYILMGVVIDILYRFVRLFRENIILFSALGGIAYMVIPLSRIVVHFTTGYIYPSFARTGYLYPVFTHFLFGAGGALLAGAIVYAIKRTRRSVGEEEDR